MPVRTRCYRPGRRPAGLARNPSVTGRGRHAIAQGNEPGTIGDLADEELGQFESLTRHLLTATTVADALRQIVDAAMRVVAGSDLVSVTVRAPDRTFHTPIRTHEFAAELDQVQYRTGQGPCLDVARPDSPGYVASDDLRTEPRWPRFAAAASGHGYRAILSTELFPAAGPGPLSGALNIYSRSPAGLDRADRHAALLLATHGSLALAHARAAELADLRQAQLRRAADSRDVIGQAKGILMNRQGISAEEAFDLLRRTSQQLNVKLVDLASTLAERHGGRTPDDRSVHCGWKSDLSRGTQNRAPSNERLRAVARSVT